jgi:hypothetical protein
MHPHLLSQGDLSKILFLDKKSPERRRWNRIISTYSRVIIMSNHKQQPSHRDCHQEGEAGKDRDKFHNELSIRGTKKAFGRTFKLQDNYNISIMKGF